MSSDNQTSVQITEQPVQLKGRPTDWSDLTPEERQAAFTAAHKGLTDVDFTEAWEANHSTRGVARQLGCSETNARNRLRKLGLVDGEPRKGGKRRANQPTNNPNRDLEAYNRVVERAIDQAYDRYLNPSPEEKLRARVAELEAERAEFLKWKAEQAKQKK